VRRAVYLAEAGRLEEAHSALQCVMNEDDRFAWMALQDDLLSAHPELTARARTYLDELLAEIADLTSSLAQIITTSDELLNDPQVPATNVPPGSPTGEGFTPRLTELRESLQPSSSEHDRRLVHIRRGLREETLPAAERLLDEVNAWHAELEQRYASLASKRATLQAMIDHAANGIAAKEQAEVRRSRHEGIVLASGYTVYPLIVMRPRRGLRPAKSWLVTLNRRGNEVVIGDSPSRR
jgi:hypothetical protein